MILILSQSKAGQAARISPELRFKCREASGFCTSTAKFRLFDGKWESDTYNAKSTWK
jgi:hypothetical protein